MALNCIPYQPIDFCAQSYCYDEAFCLRVETTDLNKVQVELTQKTGTELVTNGNFTTDTDWTKGTGWTITGGQAVASAATGNLSQASVFTIGKYYWIQFTIVVTNGLLITPIGSTNISGTYQGVFIATSTTLLFDPSPDFTGTLDNVSAKELTMVSWNLVDCETNEILVFNGDGAYGITYLETDIAAVGDFQAQSAVGQAMMEFNWDLELFSTLELPSCFCICLITESDMVDCVLRSQPICIATTHPGTMFLKGVNDDNFIVDQKHINFAQFTTMELGFRVECRLTNPGPEDELVNYSFSDFGRELTYFENKIIWDLLTEELPYPQHFALWAMMGMDHFYIDGVEYSRQGEQSKPDWTQGTDYAHFSGSVMKVGAGMMNANC